jgi:hypothetical protein
MTGTGGSFLTSYSVAQSYEMSKLTNFPIYDIMYLRMQISAAPFVEMTRLNSFSLLKHEKNISFSPQFHRTLTWAFATFSGMWTAR